MSEPAENLSRRQFLAAAAVAAAAAGALPAEGAQRGDDGPKKSVMFTMLPEALSIEERMKLAHDVGFAGVEVPPISDKAQIARMRKAAESAGVRIHSVIYGGWDPPLTSPDPAAAAQSLQNAKAALQCAADFGAEDILLVPAIVDASTPYAEAYRRSHEAIHKLIPLAEKLKIFICLEEVWNNFLLSPMEFAAYLDSFHSPWVRSYFDVGNVVIFGWPQDWIRTLGHRIKKVHLKDYKGGPGLFGGADGHWANIGEGSIDWQEVRRAFAEINYTGYMNTELAAGDEKYLRDLSTRLDRFFAGEKPLPG